MNLTPSEQHSAAKLAGEALTDPRAAERLAAAYVALKAVFAEAKRNRYLMTSPTVRPLINRVAKIEEC